MLFLESGARDLKTNHWVLVPAMALLPLMCAAEDRSDALRQRDTAILSGEDRSRLLRQSFECKAEEGTPGQAYCAEQQEAARRELAERTRRNHEQAKRRMVGKY
jgi:hypothetical protein